jgi:hypothetical protein
MAQRIYLFCRAREGEVMKTRHHLSEILVSLRTRGFLRRLPQSLPQQQPALFRSIFKPIKPVGKISVRWHQAEAWPVPVRVVGSGEEVGE